MILVETPEKYLTQVVLNRPEKRNALNGAMIQELTRIFQSIHEDKNTRVILLSAKGDHFCAGADMGWMQKMTECSQADNIEDAMLLAKLLQSIAMCSKPIIALNQGATMGGGLGIIACCDIVIAAENATFCFSEAKVGLTPSVISPYVIPVIGERSAKYYYLTAEKFDAMTAKQLQLVQNVVEESNLENTGNLFIQKLLKNSPHALTEAKKLIRHVLQEKYSDELIRYTADHLAAMRSSKDGKEGLKAFLEKREPVWE